MYILLAILLLAILMLLGIFLMLLRPAAPADVMIAGNSYSLAVADDAALEAFLAACGVTVKGCVSDRTITVPKTWNDVYTAYQELQKQQGLTLVPYKGTEAREVIYATDAGDCAAVLIADGRIIAAHRSTMQRGDALKRLIPEPA